MPRAKVLRSVVLSLAVPSSAVPSTAVPNTAVPNTAVPNTVFPGPAVLRLAASYLVVLGIGVLCLGGCRNATIFGREAVWPKPASGAIVSEHPLATQVGLDVLDKGGNAADAAVATALALAVVYPQAGNLGGGGFALYVPHVGAPQSVDFREVAPGAARAEPYLAADGKLVPERSLRGPLAVGVPGSPAGLAALLESCGSGLYTLSELCAPAIELARKGFAVDAWLARDLARPGLRESMNAAARSVFYPRGRPLREGDRLVQPDLAQTLERFAREGPRGFYSGPVADKIVRAVGAASIPSPEKGGAIGDGTGKGWITAADLAQYQAKARAPLKGWFRGMEIVTMPPPSSGGLVLLQALGILEGLPLDTDRMEALAAHAIEEQKHAATTTDVPGLSERMVHWWIEAFRASFADRAETMGDPDFVRVPVRELLSTDWIAERRVKIGEMADVDVVPWRPAGPEGTQPAGTTHEGTTHEGTQTTHFSVLDSAGNACAVTTTLNELFGSGILVDGAGFLLNNELDDFAIQSGAPNMFGLVGGAANAIAPHKRPLSSMTPTVLRDGGHANVMVLGSPGGPRIITAVAQVLLRTLVLGQTLEDAVRAPRLHQQWSPKETRFEPAFDPEIVAALQTRRKQPVAKNDSRFASVQAIRLTQLGGEPEVVSDPRRGGNGAVQGKKPTTPARPPNQ
jgi:gamma-glutamyltranspeptidase / glutathione hydrolase